MRTVRKYRILFTLLVVTAPPSFCQAPMPDRGYLQRTIEIKPTEFTQDNLAAMSRQLLAETKGYRFVQLQFVPAGQPWHPQPAPTELKYLGWRELFEQSKSDVFPFAETDATESKAILRFRGRSGIIGRTVLKGADPLQLLVERKPFRIIYLAAEPKVSRQRAGSRVERLSIFVETSERIGSQTGIVLLRELERLSGAPEVIVNVRNDVWFFSVPGYPISPPFESQPLLSREEYRNSFQMQCANVNRVWCTEVHP